MRRDYLFWGSVLILLGGLLFLNAAGIPLPGGVHAMQLFWPAVLILLGGWIILNSFWRGGVEAGPLAIDLQGAQRASLRLNYGGGRTGRAIPFGDGLWQGGAESQPFRGFAGCPPRTDARLAASV